MRLRLGGWAVAAVLVLGGCGGDGEPEAASSTGAAAGAPLAGPELVSARDTLPPAPPTSSTLTVLLTHHGDAADPGLDAAAAALAQRPDIRVVIAAGGPAAGASTMSGFPVTVVQSEGAGIVGAAIDVTGVRPDLVVVGIDSATAVDGRDPIGGAAVALGIPSLVVHAEVGDVVDHAAAAMQLLEVLDLELDTLLDGPAAVHRLTVPSCRAGTLRGRLDVRAGATGEALVTSDCTSADRSEPADEVTAVRRGYAALSRLP